MIDSDSENEGRQEQTVQNAGKSFMQMDFTATDEYRRSYDSINNKGVRMV